MLTHEQAEDLARVSLQYYGLPLEAATREAQIIADHCRRSPEEAARALKVVVRKYICSDCARIATHHPQCPTLIDDAPIFGS